MKRVAVVSYGAGNIDSVARAITECGGEAIVTSDPWDLERVSYIILPGVGSYAECIKNLRLRNLDHALHEQVLGQQIPFLGICLGMQFLAESSEEGGLTAGLGWIEGNVVRLIPKEDGARIPHVGWNDVEQDGSSILFREIPSGTNFYFVHSYHLVCSSEESVISRTPYCGSFTSAVEKDNIFGVQFHPEKSQRAGMRLFTNFLSL